MAKGSQLSQLKTALSQAGVTGKNNSKKRKRSVAPEKDKEKRAAQLDEIQRRLNPFDVKVTKLKHDVGGRKLKGITGKPAQSKQVGMEQRKKTLLKEYEEKGRTGGIVDRRFGENDPMMSLEERMLERFTKERQRTSKGIAFNLEDDDDLTHYGQSLSKLDDFDNVGLRIDSDEEETSGQIGKEIVSKTHFGGFGDEEEEGPPRKRSKAEVMTEVIAKSKEHKMRRQTEREQDDNIRHELDNQFSALRELIYVPDPSSSGSNSVPLGTREPVSRSITDPDAVLSTIVGDDGDYDQRVRELAFDKRSKPKDRTKTEEELALEEKEALEQAERRRRRRMLGQNESDSEEEGTAKGKRKRGADDLDDDFDEGLGEWNGLGAGLDQTNAAPSEESEGEDAESSRIESSDEEEAGSDEDEFSQNLDEVNEEHEDLVTLSNTSKRGSRGKKPAKQELPFTFPCPSSHEEFLQVIEDVDDEDVPIVVQRIRTLYHTSLGADNKFKLQTLASVLIDHVLFVASPPTPRFRLIASLFPHILAITRAYPIPSAQYFNQKLALMHKNLIRGLSRGALRPEAKTWPGPAELSLLRIIGLIWPTSDLNHAVVSPTRILLGTYLGLGRVRSLSDIGSGLFLCTLFFQFEALSKRLVPEAINFLVNSILHLAPHEYKEILALPGSFPSPDFRSDLCRSLSLSKKVQKGLVAQKPNLFSLLVAANSNEQSKVDLLGVALNLLGQFADMYKALDGFIELYGPILTILENIQSEYLPDGQQAQLSKLIGLISRLLKFSHQARKPLRLQAHKPIPIPTYIPKFETTSSNYLRRQDPDHERNQASKLRNEYKQERKGAIRELRKDARFLAALEQKRHIEKDRTYNERMRRVFGSIEGERAEEKTSQMVNIYLKIENCQILALSIPWSDIERLSLRPLKWLRFVTFTVCGAHGDLSATPNGPPVNYGTVSLAGPIADAYYYTPDSGDYHIVDYNALNDTITSSQQTIRSSHFRHDVMARDGPACVFTGSDSRICDAAHIVPKSKGDAYIAVVHRDRLHLYNPSLEPELGINSVENGILLSKNLHGLFRVGCCALLKTPNFALDPADIPRVEADTMPSNRITLHHLEPHTSRIPIPQLDARIAGTGTSPPSTLMLDFMYGVAAYQRWGSGLADIKEVMQQRFTKHYKPIPVPSPPLPTSDDDSSPESYDPNDNDEYKSSRQPRGRDYNSKFSDGMLCAMDNVLTLSTLFKETPTKLTTDEEQRQKEAEELYAKEASTASQVKVQHWKKSLEGVEFQSNTHQTTSENTDFGSFPN